MRTPKRQREGWQRAWPGRLLGGLAGVLAAQLATGQAPGGEQEDVIELEPLTVLGSSITRFDEESGLPVTTLEMETVAIDGFVSPGEIFTDMVFTGSPEFEESQDGPNDARGDVTSVNLRGAGPGQTLMLLNGRRLAPHPLNQTVGQAPSVLVNANVIPAGLIDRIDVLRDGASAIYGTDASAGVVNTTLDSNLLGQTVRLRLGAMEGSDFNETVYSYAGGWDFNNGRTNLSVYLSYFERDVILASDLWYAAFGDKRPLVDEKWRDNTSIINVSSGNTYANLQTSLPSSQDALSQDGKRITDSRGRFHVNAPGLPGATAVLADGTAIDDGFLPREDRYDFAPFRTMTPAVERTNAFALLTHELRPDLSFFTELGYYRSDSWQQRAATVFGSSDAIVIPADNYWNPFGPVTFADGRSNPNRLSGITLENGAPLPDEGVDIILGGWRSEDIGLRIVEVRAESYLLTGGFKGKVLDNWYWETGVRYNLNKATDRNGGSISKTAFAAALADDTAAALNVFGGPGVNDPAAFPGLALVTTRTAETDLLSYDLRVNNPEVIDLFGNPVGVAVGFEARLESYEDDRDPRLDGTIVFDDTEQGASDIIGVSPTTDAESDRDVYGFYAELLVPLVGKGNRLPLVHRMELQIAGRYEEYSDFGDVAKPKFGAVWYLTKDLFARASFARGFTAPNLSILTRPIQRFSTGRQDEFRLQWDPANGENDGSEQVLDRRGGIAGLGPEQSETWTAGIVWRVPLIEGLTLTADYYNIAITDLIGTIGTADILRNDRDILNEFSANPADYSPGQVVSGDPRVERAPIDQELINLATSQGFAPAGKVLLVNNPFVNQASRDISGWDFGFEYAIPRNAWGSFRISGNASYLEVFRDRETADGPSLNRIKREINPRLRASATLSWRNGPWSAGATVNYISETVDRDVVSTEGELWVIEDYLRVSLRSGYRFQEGILKGLRATVGVRNLFDEDPPLNPDQAFGYEPALHSNRGRFYYLDLAYAF